MAGTLCRMQQLRLLINSVVQRLREQEARDEAQEPLAQDVATPRQGLPRLLSDEDERLVQREAAGDLWSVMHDEDVRPHLENASGEMELQGWCGASASTR